MQWIHSAVHLKIQKQTEFGMGNSKIIRIKIHYVLEAIAAFKVIFHFCLLAQMHTHTHTVTHNGQAALDQNYWLKIILTHFHAFNACWAKCIHCLKKLSVQINDAHIVESSNFFYHPIPSTRPFTRFALAVGIVLNHFSVPKLLQHSVCLSRLNILHWKVYYLLSSFWTFEK